MRFKLVLLGVISTALLVTSTAFAYITAPPQGDWVSLTRCFNSGSVTVQQGDYLRAGWGTISEQQSLDFLAAQSFSLTATDTSTEPDTVHTLASWGTGDTTYFTQPTLTNAPNDFNQNRPFYFTGAFIQVNLAPKTYTLTSTSSLSRAVFDGVTVYKKGTNWFTIPTCTLTVT